MAHRFVELGGQRVFYREAGPADAPVVLLLHGFPSSSHQFRGLLAALGAELRLIAPDYPGFGHSDPLADPPAGRHTFDALTDVVERFVDALGLRRVYLYVFDFGAPVGFRLAVRRPELIAGIVTQNGNAYAEGLNAVLRELCDTPVELRAELGGRRAALFESIAPIRDQYLIGAPNPELVAPDGWILDKYFLDLPGRRAVMADLFADYPSNVDSYPVWQAWLRTHRPPLLIAWGRHDPIFGEPGARAFLRDVPDAEFHLLDAGHFALEHQLDQIAGLISAFVRRADAAETNATESAEPARSAG